MQKKMRNVFILFISCHVGLPVKHSLKYFFTETPGAQSIPEFVAVVLFNGIQIGDFNSIRGGELKKDWVRFFDDYPQQVERYVSECKDNQPFFKANIENLKKRFNQTEGVHILQRMNGCEWDDETGEIKGFNQYGYDGEDFVALDLQTLTWIAPKPQAVTTKLRWDAQKTRLKFNQNFLSFECPTFLKMYLHYGTSFLQTVLPSVSLLQKTPSSPVSCHATGFYPDRAKILWRKNGEEIHKDVYPGEILPNNDGTFQMSVDLKLSSITPEDWQRYDCVFHLSGVNKDIITKLDKTVIRNNMEKPTGMVTFISTALVIVTFILITALAFVAYKKKKAPDDGSEQSENLSPQS